MTVRILSQFVLYIWIRGRSYLIGTLYWPEASLNEGDDVYGPLKSGVIELSYGELPEQV